MEIHPLYGVFEPGFRPYLYDTRYEVDHNCAFRIRDGPPEAAVIKNVRATMCTFFPQDIQDHIGYLDGNSKNTHISNLVFFQGNLHNCNEVVHIKQRLQLLVQDMETLTQTVRNILINLS
jgi:hypothetical protein